MLDSSKPNHSFLCWMQDNKTKEEHIKLSCSRAGNRCKVAINFNRKHGKDVTRETVAEVIENLKKTQVTSQFEIA